MKKTISFLLNRQKVSIEAKPSLTLLELLRDHLGVKSPKCGCDRGDCGTCTVLLDGATVRGCLVLGVEVDGHEVTTLEGLMDAGLTPLQQAFVDRSSFQCGFCAPGMVLSITALLGKNAHPTREELQEAMAGNLCRCTGYHPIMEAVEKFLAETAGKELISEGRAAQ